MSGLKTVCLVAIMGILLGGCVSKKKYLELADSKAKLEESFNKMKLENDGLHTSLDQSVKDYKDMKDYLYASDAAKNDELNNLQAELDEIESSYNLIKEDLDKTKDLFKDQKYFSAKASSEIARLQLEVKQLSRDTVSLNHSIELARNRVKEYQDRAATRTDQLNEKNMEISDLNKTVRAKDTEIDDLKLAVEAEKKKIKDINDSFVALRRQLVAGKGSGEPIDPNSNSNIDKISHALGHY